MEFDYVVGFYSKVTRSVNALGGFNSLRSAKDFSNTVDTPALGNGFMFIDSPEGIYINGYDGPYVNYGAKMDWFPLESNKAWIHDTQKDKVTKLDGFMLKGNYSKFIQGNVFEAFKKPQTIDKKTEEQRKERARERARERREQQKKAEARLYRDVYNKLQNLSDIQACASENRGSVRDKLSENKKNAEKRLQEPGQNETPEKQHNYVVR